MKQSQILSHLIERAKLVRAGQVKLAAVFDLDSTLFNVAPRITQILRDFSLTPKFQKLFPKECEILAQTVHHPLDWGIEITLKRAGVPIHPAFFGELNAYWLERFHSNHYLHHDEPIRGGPDFVQNLHELGANRIYLTGRDIPRYAEGTARVLEQHRFPLKHDTVTLALKSHHHLPDAPFKRDYLSELAGKYQEIWFFENEPVNINLVLRDLPQIKVVFFDGTHSGKEEVANEILRIRDFTQEE